MTFLRPWAVCPHCGAPLSGGPVIFWCANGHGQFHGSVLHEEAS